MDETPTKRQKLEQTIKITDYLNADLISLVASFLDEQSLKSFSICCKLFNNYSKFALSLLMPKQLVKWAHEHVPSFQFHADDVKSIISRQDWQLSFKEKCNMLHSIGEKTRAFWFFIGIGYGLFDINFGSFKNLVEDLIKEGVPITSPHQPFLAKVIYSFRLDLIEWLVKEKGVPINSVRDRDQHPDLGCTALCNLLDCIVYPEPPPSPHSLTKSKMIPLAKFFINNGVHLKCLSKRTHISNYLKGKAYRGEPEVTRMLINYKRKIDADAAVVATLPEKQ